MHLRIMTWNVENLFRPHANAPAAERTTYKRKLALIADTLVAQRIEVAAFQEIGSPEALDDLQRALRGEYAHVAMSDQPDPCGIRVAILSRRPFEAVSQFSLLSDGHSHRGALRVQVQVSRRHVSILTAHLKSKLLSFPGPDGTSAFTTNDEQLRAQVAAAALIQRTTEAVTLRNIASALLNRSAAPNDSAALNGGASPRHGRTRQPVILVGDLNDVPEAATTQILLGPPGSQPGTRAFARADDGDCARLFNLANFIPLERRYSRINNGVAELIDHILVSEDGPNSANPPSTRTSTSSEPCRRWARTPKQGEETKSPITHRSPPSSSSASREEGAETDATDAADSTDRRN
jgi:endonuclease/exonuclease/phosphatase family metal-dependent hydrolase